MRVLFTICGSFLLLAAALLSLACADGKTDDPRQQSTSVDRPSYDRGLLLSLAVLGKTEDGKPLPLPAELGMLRFQDGAWSYDTVKDDDSNVFHKAMPFQSQAHGEGILTLGGSAAVVKLWRPDRRPVDIWRADFGGRFSRMRDGEIADLYGDGSFALALATHDQGVVATVRADGESWTVDELDREPDTFVHEIEVGDLDADGVIEIYATPSARNKLDGSPQPGVVTRYVPQHGGERTVVADLDDRHAKEILVQDVDGDGKDELYVVVEAVSGGTVEILRFDSDTDPMEQQRVAELPDKLCRFLTAGDIDGDGKKEVVAAGSKSGLWLLEPRDPGEPWLQTSIDRDSGGFEHASLLTDLDGDGRDELYVASDTHGEVRRYIWRDGAPERQVIHRHPGGLKGFTWNLAAFPARLQIHQEPSDG